MGLFSRKKKIEAPAPPSEDLLNFPKPSQVEKIIKPDSFPEPQPFPEKPHFFSKKHKALPPLHNEIKTAVGLDKPTIGPFKQETTFLSMSEPSFPTRFPTNEFFIRVNHYQNLSENLDTIKKINQQMEEGMQKIDHSEFNERKHYEKMKKQLKIIHSQLISMDEIIFKR